MENRIVDVMHPRPPSVDPGVHVADALKIARGSPARHVLVGNDRNVLGIVCTCDLESAAPDAAVESIMSAPVVTAPALDTLAECAELMCARGVGCLPVTVGGLIIGMVTLDDLRRAGVPDEKLTLKHCAACGSYGHVRPSARYPDVHLCEDCRARANSPGTSEELGQGD